MDTPLRLEDAARYRWYKCEHSNLFGGLRGFEREKGGYVGRRRPVKQRRWKSVMSKVQKELHDFLLTRQDRRKPVKISPGHLSQLSIVRNVIPSPARQHFNRAFGRAYFAIIRQEALDIRIGAVQRGF